MQIEITEIEPCKLAVHYEANTLEIMDKRHEVQNAFKKAPVPGFREGKASMDAIKMHYRQQIEDSLKRALAEDAFHNTLFEKKLRPHGAPRFTSLMLDNGKFTCEFEIFTKPDFELSDWKNLEIPKPHEDTTVAQVAELMMQDLRVRFGEVVPYSPEDFVQNGDNIIIDYEGSIDGEAVDSLKAEGEMLTVGKSPFVGKSPLLGFDSNILGMSMGETREFDFVAPEGGLPSISGKTIHFKLTVVVGSKSVPCALDDSLAQKLNKKDFAELQDFVAQAAFARVEVANRMRLHEAVAKRLVEDTKIDVPNWMSLSEAQYLAHNSQLDWNTISDSDKVRLIETSEKNVKLSLILDKIRELEPHAQLTDQEVFEMIKQNLANTKTDKNLDEVIQEMNRTGYLQILFSRIKDEHAMDFIVKSIKVIE